VNIIDDRHCRTAAVYCHIARKAVPAIERLENVPAPVSAIIMKLLAECPEVTARQGCIVNMVVNNDVGLTLLWPDAGKLAATVSAESDRLNGRRLVATIEYICRVHLRAGKPHADRPVYTCSGWRLALLGT
jgi:hypothetical protein